MLESILAESAAAIGAQYQPYKNHVYRVLNFCFAVHTRQGDEQEKLIIAGCFHDLGMWPDDTVDYLAPSIALAQAYLHQRNKAEWLDEISEIIDLHHKFRQVRHSRFPLVEVFRRGDWVDAGVHRNPGPGEPLHVGHRNRTRIKFPSRWRPSRRRTLLLCPSPGPALMT